MIDETTRNGEKINKDNDKSDLPFNLAWTGDDRILQKTNS